MQPRLLAARDGSNINTEYLAGIKKDPHPPIPLLAARATLERFK